MARGAPQLRREVTQVWPLAAAAVALKRSKRLSRFLRFGGAQGENVTRLQACPLFTISYYLFYLALPARGLCQRVPARGLRFNNCVRLAMAFEDLHCTPRRDDERQRDEH